MIGALLFVALLIAIFIYSTGAWLYFINYEEWERQQKAEMEKAKRSRKKSLITQLTHFRRYKRQREQFTADYEQAKRDLEDVECDGEFYDILDKEGGYLDPVERQILEHWRAQEELPELEDDTE